MSMTLEQLQAALAASEAKVKALETAMASKVKVRLSEAGDMICINTGTRRYDWSFYKNEIPLVFSDAVKAEALRLAESIPDNLPKINKSVTNGKTLFRR